MTSKHATPNLEVRQRRAALTAERVRQVFVYDQNTGAITYRIHRGNMVPGDPAGTIKADGRRTLRLDGMSIVASRLAWLYMTGAWPKNEIDHWDTDHSNDRWDNLRDVTSVVNKQNLRRASKSKKHSPLLGAQWSGQRNKWHSAIKVYGKVVGLGFFDTDVEASQAYIAAKRVLHEGCTI